MENKIENTKSIDLSKILKPYENKWVALSYDYKQVFSNGKTLESAIENLKEKSPDEVIFMKVLPFDLAYVPTTL